MNKHSHDPSPPLEEHPLIATLGENPAVQWVSHNGRMILWILLALIALSLMIYRLTGANISPSADYFRAENEFRTFQKEGDSGVQQEALSRLSNLLKSHPDLEPKFDGPIAQTLLNRTDLQQALLYANRTIARVNQDNLPTYENYAKTTLMISGQNYADALKHALALKTQMQDEKQKTHMQATPALYIYNLLRIAMLQQEVGTKEEEKNAWKEFKDAASTAGIPRQTFDAIIRQVEIGKISIMSYIEMREKKLSP